MSNELEDIDLAPPTLQDSYIDAVHEDETNVEIVLECDPYPEDGNYDDLKDETFYPGLEKDENLGISSDFSDAEEIEFPRGVPVEKDDLCTSFMREEIKLKEEEEVCIDPELKRTLNFVEWLKKDGDWARTISNEVKLSVDRFPLEKTLDIIDFLTYNINNRPKICIIMSKKVNLDSLEKILSIAFNSLSEEVVIPEIHTMLRIYLKNPVDNFKDLCKLVVGTAHNIPHCQVEGEDIFGEFEENHVKKRYRTSDVRQYFDREHIARRLHFKIFASFVISNRRVKSRDVSVRWMDEPKLDGRSTYIQIDHFGYPSKRVAFSQHRSETWVEVGEGKELIETKHALPSVNDLIEILDRKKYK